MLHFQNLRGPFRIYGSKLLNNMVFSSLLLSPCLTVYRVCLGVCLCRCVCSPSSSSSSFSSLGILFLSVAVSSTDRQDSRLVAFFHADERPIFSGFKSDFITRSQIWLGFPFGRFQSEGGFWLFPWL